jgi:hypothetical protein
MSIEDEIVALATQADVGLHRMLTLLREYDAKKQWAKHGMKSCVAWLGWRVGIGHGAAREHVRVARALGKLPSIDAAMAGSRISYSKVRALTRTATPENEEKLLGMALAATASQLEHICRGVRVMDAQYDGVKKPELGRFVRTRSLPDGTIVLEARLEVDEAKRVLDAIDRARAGIEVAPDCPDDERPSRADGLVKLAEDYVAGSQETESRTGGDRSQIYIHLAPDILSESLSATLDDGTLVPAETFRKISCDAGLIAIATDAQGHPLDVGRKTRTIPPSIRRAVEARDRCCRFPGCANRASLDAHHAEHWIHGGETRLSNLVLLCPFHHRLVHDGGFEVRMFEEGRRIVFRRPDGTEIDRGPRRVPVPEHSPPPADPAQRTFWHGEKPDYDFAVQIACQHRHRTHPASAH